MSDPTAPSSTPRNLLLAKISTTASYLLLLVTSIYYLVKSPETGRYTHGRFWHHNPHTPFAQSAIVTSIYWLLLFILQAHYLFLVFKENSVGLGLAPQFVASNLLLFGFVQLFVRSEYWLSLLLIVINFFNLTYLYFKFPTSPRLTHIGVVSGPLAWNFVALYWVGAVAIVSNSLAARIVANVFIWGWLGYGVFFLAAYKDYTLGLELAILAFSTGLGQVLTPPYVLQLQYVFAFTISGLLLLLSIAVGVPGILGREPFPRGQIVSEDQERAPLLADE